MYYGIFQNSTLKGIQPMKCLCKRAYYFRFQAKTAEAINIKFAQYKETY